MCDIRSSESEVNLLPSQAKFYDDHESKSRTK